jgi:hypothetical protein
MPRMSTALRITKPSSSRTGRYVRSIAVQQGSDGSRRGSGLRERIHKPTGEKVPRGPESLNSMRNCFYLK